MSRQVDVKALVSHIVRGDGADKCRICLGDTTEGQVYLGDTVIMEGDKPVTLSELLEYICGVEVQLEEGLPSGICISCTAEAQRAARFRTLCQQSLHHWTTSVELLDLLPRFKKDHPQKHLCAILGDDNITIVNKKFVFGEEDETDDDKSSDQSAGETSDSEKHSEDEHRVATKPKYKNYKENLTCPDCEKKFSCPMLMYQHFMHSGDGRRSCYICAKIMSRNELLKHIRQAHKCVPYDCKKCPAIFQTKLHLNKHLESAHALGSHVCGDCGQNFSSIYAYNGHMIVHSAMVCPVCDKFFRNHCCYLHHRKHVCKIKKNANRILKTKHKTLYELTNNDNKNGNENNNKNLFRFRGNDGSPCICDYCGKLFAGKKTICAHIQIVHLKNTHKPCPYCGKELAAAHMPTHLQKHEQSPITYKCNHCGVELKTKLGYIQHQRLHTGEMPYPCRYCTESFSGSSRRSEHVRRVHRKIEAQDLKHACNKCPARFRLPYRLKKHLATVHNDSTKEVEYECGQCHIQFASCRGLVNHTKRHESFKLKNLYKE